MFGGWDAALVNQDYEINWLISPQYEGVTKRFTEKLAGVVLEMCIRDSCMVFCFFMTDYFRGIILYISNFLLSNF